MAGKKQSSRREDRRRRPALPDWRSYLTPSESVELEALEANKQNLDSKRAALCVKIRNLRDLCDRRRRAALYREAAARRAA